MNSLTPEERTMLAAAYESILADVMRDDPDALAAMEDPFWVLYADTVLGGYVSVRAAVDRARKRGRTHATH